MGAIDREQAPRRAEAGGEIGQPPESEGGNAGGAGGAAPGVGAPAVSAPAVFVCTPDAAPPAAPLRRLTTAQHRNTVRDLLALAGSPDAHDEVRPALDRMPIDRRERLDADPHGSYRRLDQSLQDAHVEAQHEVARAAGAALTKPARIGRTLGACATNADLADDAECVRAFVRRFGERVLRRPLTPAETDQYVAFHGAETGVDPAGVADVIAALFLAPELLYLVETGTSEARPGVVSLSAYELAARLSYHFWQTTPDGPLWEAARSGALATEAGFAAQVDRLFGDARTRATMDEFFADYTKVEELPALHERAQDPAFKAFAAAAVPTPELRAAAMEETVELFRDVAWRTGGGFSSLLATERSFTRNAELARLYGVPVWSGAGEPPMMPAGVRPGFLTRVAFLASGSATTRPIMKGVYLRRNLLCDEIPPPPDNANADPPPLGATLSARQVAEALTEREGTGCRGCHATLINGLGFAMEGFDALGRVRTGERIFGRDGAELGVAPVDTRAVPRVALDDERPVAGAPELMRRIAESGRAQACFARHYFRFAYGRWEDVARDGCALERLRRAIDGSGTVAGMLREVALAPEFKQRTIGGTDGR